MLSCLTVEKYYWFHALSLEKFLFGTPDPSSYDLLAVLSEDPIE